MNRLLRFALVFLLVGLVPTSLEAQSKRALDHDDYAHWNAIRNQALSADGQWLHYAFNPHEGDGRFFVHRLSDDFQHTFERGVGASFTPDARFAVFRISPRDEAVREARAKRTRAADMPKDSLAILDMRSGEVLKIEKVKAFQLADESSRWLAYHLESAPAPARPDTTAAPAERAEPAGERPGARPGQPAGRRPGAPLGEGTGEQADEPKKREKSAGTPLVLRDLTTGAETRFDDVTMFQFTKNGSHLVYVVSGKDGAGDGIYALETRSGTVRPLMTGEGQYTRLALNEAGTEVAFLSNRDDWASDPAEDAAQTVYRAPLSGTATAIASEGTAGIPMGWWISPNRSPNFSEDGRRLFFGTAPRPAPKVEELPEAERVVVDIWNWQDPYIQPMQLVQANQERQRSYLAVAHLDRRVRVVQLADEHLPSVVLRQNGDASHALGMSDLPYRQLVSWDGRYSDVYLVNVQTGERTRILDQIRGSAQLSPTARYVFWWDGTQQAWFARGLNGQTVNLTAAISYPVHNLLHDTPQPPGSYGLTGWTENDRHVLINDEHDIWLVDPTGAQAPINVTGGAGRANNLRLRYVRLDRDEDAIPLGQDVLLSSFDYHTKGEGFYQTRFAARARDVQAPRHLLSDNASFSNPVRAADADVLLLTRSTWNEFPDLHVTDSSLRNPRRVTDANPQIAEYQWGTAELTEWVSVDGIPLQGILYKPENFDPNHKYPMMVYFYERSSQGLHRFHTPQAGGSSISLPFYVSRGYVVFVPDIPYKPGFPGESAMNAVMPGVLSLISQGFVDRERIGVQGHSWGGYQITYMITRTNLFAAAEAGAPVVNMTSAYGGIRWDSGMVRQFQYEQTQSRIGGTLWDASLRYIENSPIFEAYKVETPLLMLHNDRDGAVPWEQGIEFFVALRRLGKPVWMLNYNGERHGLSRQPNRKDWAIRMQQFFDHYLMDAPAPVWMAEGVPAVRKGQTLGLELVEQPVLVDDLTGGSHQ
jgi:dienelactone hydrolase